MTSPALGAAKWIPSTCLVAALATNLITPIASWLAAARARSDAGITLQAQGIPLCCASRSVRPTDARFGWVKVTLGMEL